MGMNDDQSQDACYLCGTRENLTRDHIPPKCMFPEPRPSNLITVPCCYPCNHSLHKEDEKLRLFTSMGFNRNEKGDIIWNRKVVEHTIKEGRQRETVSHIIASMREVVRATPLGMLRAPYVTIPQREIASALIRIIKGLLYLNYRDVDRNELDYNVLGLDQLKLNETIAYTSGPLHCRGERGDGVFRYWGDVIPDSRDAGVWVILFYDSAGFGIFHQDKKRAAARTKTSSATQH